MREDCPRWCVGDHPDDTEATGEAVHATGAPPIPVVSLVSTGEDERAVVTEELDITLFRFFGPKRDPAAEEEWVFVGSDYRGLTVTRESALRLYRRLGDLLALTAFDA